MIVFNYDSFGSGVAQNSKKSNISGHEYSLKINFKNFLINHKGYIAKPFQEIEGIKKVIPGVPEREWVNSISYRPNKLSFTLEHIYKSPVFLDESNLLLIEGQNIYNASVSYFKNDYGLTFRVNDLFDVREMDSKGIPGKGRHYNVSLWKKF